ncbi:glutamyl- or glutaminyl-tRNA synthetase [Bernardetia litoralis DSM 6794]|uniref:Glutamyl-or glutaminyl-tRNA synthetase n=1 Tax=Bernardetia litoralis (strain ATCC 23117 / DSM 6794 / NBRC 15988 / NCIMB 1366 / Fx l1 / Sio-4) TaxID=880071 RepID=I4AJ67_BERLS|nr:glutamate--tRNA ligase family protein [Bernardetia litoralis]AFM04002.1 glutamyl- or glutaminyl-tRNA synthetase [Bernardetia litoralis DSM 6794]
MNYSKIKSILNSIQSPIHSRIAPTPSGFLHKGNAFSFLLTWILVRKTGGTLTLRIDDIDKNRKRPEYLQDIFDTLHFLGIDWDKGAKNPQDFEANYSQHYFLEIYQKEIEILQHKNAVFECICSRSEILKRNNKNNYDGFCLKNNSTNTENQKKAAFRINTDFFDKKNILINDCQVNVSTEMPYFVIQKKDLLPAYQLVSLIDDYRMNINFIVRGKDLISSTAAQLFLAEILDKKTFLETTFLHHDLILDKEKNKISKSAGNKYNSFSVKFFRENGGTREDFLKEFCEWIHIEPKESLQQILNLL